MPPAPSYFRPPRSERKPPGARPWRSRDSSSPEAHLSGTARAGCSQEITRFLPRAWLRTAPSADCTFLPRRTAPRGCQRLQRIHGAANPQPIAFSRDPLRQGDSFSGPNGLSEIGGRPVLTHPGIDEQERAGVRNDHVSPSCLRVPPPFFQEPVDSHRRGLERPSKERTETLRRKTRHLDPGSRLPAVSAQAAAARKSAAGCP